MIAAGTYIVVETDDMETVHNPQGTGVPCIGDIVTVADREDTRWSNQWGNWCWAECEAQHYGANFHESHLAAVEQ